jgi:uncharacterized protein
MKMDGENKRIHVIDGMRGFSLLGILAANMLIFQYGMFGKDEMEAFSPSGLDSFLHEFLKVFVESSFMPIFTFLFGYSLIKLKEGLEDKGLKYRRHLVRRFFLLLVLGGLHGGLLWEGDILFSYGIMGFFLLLFLNRKKKTLLVWGMVLLFLASFMGYGMDSAVPADEVKRMDEYVADTIKIYGTGTYGEISFHRNNADPFGMPGSFYLFMMLAMPFITAPLFLFGMYAAKRRSFHEIGRNKSRYLLWGGILTGAGILLKASPLMVTETGWTGVLYMFGGNILSLGYIFLFAWLYAVKGSAVLFRAFESVGRLSLSNYLWQSVICTTVFYGYGLGLFGKLGVLAGILLTVAIYSVQLAGSYFYLKLFRTGPFEKIMRMWTYFSLTGRPKMKKAKEDRDLLANAQ